MLHQHSHGSHVHKGGSTKNIKVALFLNLGFSIIEFVGGLLTGSVAVLSDAVHDFGDSLSLGSAYILETLAQKKSDSKYSYGYRRLSLLSALITSAFLFVASIGVIIYTIPRLLNPITPHLTGMFALSLLGIAVNGYGAFRVMRGNTLNEKVVSWHLVEDILGWVAVLVSSLVMMVADLPILDPLLSIIFSAFILWGVFRSLRQTLTLFFQGVPAHIDITKMKQDICEVPSVKDTHDVHFWSLDGDAHVMTLHAVIDANLDLKTIQKVKEDIRAIISAAGNIHATIEVEREGEDCPDIACAD
jgi:cobalt-zinc-cadmium efflux system protein